MKNRIYTVYNTLTKRYGNVFEAATDEWAEKITREGYTFANKQEDLDTIELCRVGTIDIETGRVETEDPIRIAIRKSEIKMPTKQTN